MAVVTGASRGIGRAVAVELDRRGFDVVAAMRNPEAAEGLPSSIHVERLDVTDIGDFAFPGDTTVLVNNAGVRQAYLPVEEATYGDWMSTFLPNVFGLAELCRRVVPVLREGGGGVICNVSSSSILLPLPFFAIYRASKAAVSAITDSLRIEVAPFGIRVVEILPGPIDTDLLRSSVQYRPPDAIDYPPYRLMAERTVGTPETAIATPPEDAAVAIADAVMADGGPLRYGCDPVSIAHLERWRTTSDEEILAGMLEHFGTH